MVAIPSLLYVVDHNAVGNTTQSDNLHCISARLLIQFYGKLKNVEGPTAQILVQILHPHLCSIFQCEAGQPVPNHRLKPLHGTISHPPPQKKIPAITEYLWKSEIFTNKFTNKFTSYFLTIQNLAIFLYPPLLHYQYLWGVNIVYSRLLHIRFLIGINLVQ